MLTAGTARWGYATVIAVDAALNAGDRAANSLVAAENQDRNACTGRLPGPTGT